jgi:hypothetical protein
MKPTEALSLQAFLVALSEIDITLPTDFKQAIHQVGYGLAQHQRGSIEAIWNLVERHALLHQLYDLAWLVLQKQYQNHEYTQQLLSRDLPERAALALETMAAQVFTTEDPQIAAQAQIRTRPLPEPEPGYEELRLFLESLYRAAAAIETQAAALLRALERQPLTIENLCYALQLSADQVKALVQYLWNAGYIAQTTGSVLDKLFPRWGRRPFQVAKIDSPSYFTLTAKGHFHLHPIVTAGRREGLSW